MKGMRMVTTLRVLVAVAAAAVQLLCVSKSQRRPGGSHVALALVPSLIVSSTKKTLWSTHPSSTCVYTKKDPRDDDFRSRVQENKFGGAPLQPPKALEMINDCTSGTQARRLLESILLSTSSNSYANNNVAELDSSLSSSTSRKALFGSISIPPGASQKGISDGDLAIQTRLVNRKYQIMELIELTGDRDMDRISWSILSVFLSSSFAAIMLQQNLPGPEILRFIVVWILTFAPLAVVGYGLLNTDRLQAVLVQVQRWVFPAYRQRMIQHEAGHFLMGHLLGWPIQGYNTNAVKNAVSFYPLRDVDKGRDMARQLGFDQPRKRTASDDGSDYDLWPLPRSVKDSDAAPFFSPEGRGGDLVKERSAIRNGSKQEKYDEFMKLPSQNDPTQAWPYRGFDECLLDQLTVISVAGICAEILAFGNAEGGLADLSQLRQLFAASEEEMTEREIENRIRFSLAYTLSQLRLHLGALDALAMVMDRSGSVAECVWAIESCQNVSGQTGILGDYERERRKRFQASVGWIEQKSIDATEDRFVEGKGGGDRKQEAFALAGDDPLYFALASSLIFLLWASSGGLSLH